MTTVPGEQAPPPAAGSKLKSSNLTQRILTAALLGPLALIVTAIGGWLFTLMALAIAVIALLEFYTLEHNSIYRGSAGVGLPMGIAVVLSFHFDQPLLTVAALLIGGAAAFVLESLRDPGQTRRNVLQTAMTYAGVLYIALPAGFLISLRARPDGLSWILITFALTWATDTFAYLGGRLWGKRLLAPTISPKKTVEGAIAGYFGGAVTTLLVLALTDKLLAGLIVMTLIGPILAMAGDLFESAIKRFFGAKDSHLARLDIFPGHGGALDRIDSLIVIAALVFIAAAVVH